MPRRPLPVPLLALGLCVALAGGGAPALAGKPRPPAAPKKPGPIKPDPARGKKLFVTALCKDCHTTKDHKGGLQGPDLSGAGAWTAARIRSYIVKPKRGSIMPAYKGPARDVEDLTAYLGRQR